MKIGTWLAAAVRKLDAAGAGTARLDVLVLLEDVLGIDRAHVLAHPERVLEAEQRRSLDAMVARRVTHEPLAYIRGRTEFYGRTFFVDNRVLEPRPESEMMIELLLGLFGGPEVSEGVVVDVGTGSGALAVTAFLELAGAQVIATDIDSGCLEVARHNASLLDADVSFVQGDLLAPVLHTKPGPVAAVLANLPYVPDNFQINLAAGHEPSLALYGGPDGLDLYRRMFAQISDITDIRLRPRYVLAESLPPQHASLEEVAVVHGYELVSEADFIQVFELSQ